MTKIHALATVLLLISCNMASAREVKDTLFSESGDRIILTYNITNSGGQMAVHFINAQKKLGTTFQKKYKKLDEVAVVFFDRNGNYTDMKFDGMETSAFMVPANVTYTRSSDGYFLLSDNPSLQFKVAQNEDALVNLPVYLASYEGKRHYKIFAQCGTLKLSSKKAKSGSSRSNNASGGGGNSSAYGGGGEVYAANADNIQIVGETEELVDEGLSPAEEALIRINSLKSMLEEATEYPFDEELTHEAAMLRELRFKVTDDEDVSKQISEALASYDAKKKELAGEAKANQAAQAAQQAEAAQAAQARNDSIMAAQAQQSEDDKKTMMWIGGGIGLLALLFMGGKQVVQMINQHKLEKQQKAMMEKMMNMAQKQAANMDHIAGMNNANELASMGRIGAAAIPGMGEAGKAIKETTATVQNAQQQTRTMSREAEAAKQKLMQMRATKNGIPPTVQPEQPQVQSQVQSRKPARPSLNDAIPSTYKRLAKRKSSSNDNTSSQ